MCYGFRSFFGVVLYQAQVNLFEFQCIGEAEHQPVLMLPSEAVRLGRSDLVRQGPAGIASLGLLVVRDRLPEKFGLGWQRRLDPIAQRPDIQNFNANDRVELFAKFVNKQSTCTKNENFFVLSG
jgi:hypothetical protein